MLNLLFNSISLSRLTRTINLKPLVSLGLMCLLLNEQAFSQESISYAWPSWDAYADQLLQDTDLEGEHQPQHQKHTEVEPLLLNMNWRAVALDQGGHLMQNPLLEWDRDVFHVNTDVDSDSDLVEHQMPPKNLFDRTTRMTVKILNLTGADKVMAWMGFDAFADNVDVEPVQGFHFLLKPGLDSAQVSLNYAY